MKYSKYDFEFMYNKFKILKNALVKFFNKFLFKIFR